MSGGKIIDYNDLFIYNNIMQSPNIAPILYNIFRKYLGLTEIKKCVMMNFDNKCVAKIIKAHSISKSKGLKEISSKVNNKNVVGRFFRKNLYASLPISQNIDIIYQDVKSASVFTGLCKYHDNSLFTHIDNSPMEIKSEIHIFEYTLRNCIFNYYDRLSNIEGVIERKKYIDTRINVDLTGTDDIYTSLSDSKNALENDLNKFKNYLINNDISNKILYKLYPYKGNINIAGNLCIVDNEDVYYITFIPNNKKSYILVSTLIGDNIFVKNDFFEYLRNMTPIDFDLFISRQLLKVGSIRNYFFNYEIYINLDESIRDYISELLDNTNMNRFMGYVDNDLNIEFPNFIRLMTQYENK